MGERVAACTVMISPASLRLDDPALMYSNAGDTRHSSAVRDACSPFRSAMPIHIGNSAYLLPVMLTEQFPYLVQELVPISSVNRKIAHQISLPARSGETSMAQ